MNIENIRYDILSRGENLPEIFPNVNDNITLNVRPDTPQPSIVLTADIKANAAERLGPYCHIIGSAQVADENNMPCDAKYLVDGKFPSGELIGELILKKVTE
jgi:hypothetical protein